MFVLAGLMGLLLAGVAADISISAHQNEADDDPDQGDVDDAAATPDEGATEGQERSPLDEASDIADAEKQAATNAVSGTDDRDALIGTEGNDLIEGHGGDDDLRGGLGDDTLLAGDGNDWVQGELRYGPGGNDLIDGGAGDDDLAGQGGDDTILGGDGFDTIFGGDGDDLLYGGAGDDWLSGNAGDDTLVAEDGADDMSGGDGDDLLIGNDDPARAWMHGGDGNDTLNPGIGDFAEGQDGADTYILRDIDGEAPIIAGYDHSQDQLLISLPDSLDGDQTVELIHEQDGTTLIVLNNQAIGRLVGASGDLQAEDIQIIRHSA